MRNAPLFVAGISLALALSGCAQRSEAIPEAPAPANVRAATATSIKPLDQKKFGTAITESAKTPLDSLVKEPTKFSAKTVRTEGVVSAVCQEMGCWMEIADDAGTAHIKMAGHSFFIPKQASGHRAIIQGKVLSGDKDHCTEEAAQATGVVAKVQIEATGVEFLD